LVCAPKSVAKGSKLVSCTTVYSLSLDALGLTNLGFPPTFDLTPTAGVCLPKCIVDATQGSTLLNLTQSSCTSDNEYCVPCDIAGGLVPNGCNG
jgi:hypothetical protein